MGFLQRELEKTRVPLTTTPSVTGGPHHEINMKKGTGNLFWASVASIADRTDNKEAYLHKNLVGNDLPFEIDPSCLLWNRLKTADRREYARLHLLLTAQKSPRPSLVATTP